MYGTSSWKEDLTNVGIPLPSVTPEKEEEQKKMPTADPRMKKKEEESSSNSLDDDVISAIAFDEVVPLTLSEDVIAVVVCGKKSESGSCTSLSVLKEHKHVKEVIPIYECPSVVDGESGDGNGEDNSNNNKVHTRIEKIYDCEMKITEELKAKLGSSNRKIQLLVLDNAASYGMHRIMNSIFDTYVNRGVLLHTHSIAVTWSSSSSSSSLPTTKKKEPWRREFLERYRKQIHHDPVKLGEIVIYSSKDGDEKGSISKSSSLSSSSSPCVLRVVSTNNVNVNYEFDRLEQRLRNRLNNAESGSGTNVNVKVELRKIHGGLYNYKEKGGSHKPPKVFYQKDYNNTSALEHFQNQVIVGRQYIFQYEIDPALKKLKDAEESLKTLSFDDVDQIVQAALISKVDNLIDLSEQEQDSSTIHVRYPIGDGGVYFTSHGRFNVIAVWDGREHVDVNLFAFEDLFDGASSSADGNDTQLQLQDTVNVRIQELSVLKDVAIDIQPRGYGHVINFPEDLVPRESPLDPYLDPDDYEEVEEEDEEEEDDDEETEDEDLDEEEYDNEEHDEDEDLDEEEEDDEEYYDEDEDDEDEYEELPSSEGEL